MTRDRRPGTGIVKHSLVIAGHRTSISLEEIFWTALRQRASESGQSLGDIVAAIDRERGSANLCSAIRVHLFRQAASSVQPGDQDAADRAGSSTRPAARETSSSR